MSFKENLSNILNLEKTEQLTVTEAHKQEGRATVAFLEGKISLEKFHQSLKETHPLTKINLRKLASQ